MFSKIKYYYDKGIYKKKHILVFLNKGVITQEQYDEIVGGDE